LQAMGQQYDSIRVRDRGAGGCGLDTVACDISVRP